MSAASTTTWPQVGKYPTQPLRWPAGLSHLPTPEERVPAGESTEVPDDEAAVTLVSDFGVLDASACQHPHRIVTKHYTYGMAWRCEMCGRYGEDWWD